MQYFALSVSPIAWPCKYTAYHSGLGYHKKWLSPSKWLISALSTCFINLSYFVFIVGHDPILLR